MWARNGRWILPEMTDFLHLVSNVIFWLFSCMLHVPPVISSFNHLNYITCKVQGTRSLHLPDTKHKVVNNVQFSCHSSYRSSHTLTALPLAKLALLKWAGIIRWLHLRNGWHDFNFPLSQGSQSSEPWIIAYMAVIIDISKEISSFPLSVSSAHLATNKWAVRAVEGGSRLETKLLDREIGHTPSPLVELKNSYSLHPHR